MRPETSKERNWGAEFMLEEYKRLHELGMASINRSEQRVNFFITISSAIVGVLIVLSQTAILSTKVVLAVIVGALAVLLTFGVTTLNRVISGSVERRAYDKLSARIQDYFAISDPHVAAYLEFQEEALQGPRHRFRPISKILYKFRGTLTDFMVLSNSLICGGIALAILSFAGYPLGYTTFWTVMAIVISLIAFYGYRQCLVRKLPPSKEAFR
jgi:hypothetical protein